jgi:ABC-2 type transport system permease protein
VSAAPVPKRSWTKSRTIVIARTDLRQLAQSPDFWAPMVVLALLFFVVVPGILLVVLTRLPEQGVAASVSSALDLLPQQAQSRVLGDNPVSRTSYALAVYLFAPIAVIVPMTISTAVGANCLVGEREKGTGEWLAQSPATVREIYLGKLIASLLPGYLTTLIGFGLYSLLVNVVVGPRVGGWFFPTRDWWLLMLLVVPPFLALTLSVVLRLSGRVRSAAAAQQASGLVTLPLIMLSYAQSSGALFGTRSALVFGVLAWTGAAWGLIRGQRAVQRSRLLGVD